MADNEDNKLDRALGEIISSRTGDKDVPRRRNQPRHSIGARKPPAGGIQKTRAPTRRPVAARVPTRKFDKAPKAASKIIINNLPDDVNDEMIKVYLAENFPNVINANINYDPNGRSRREAIITFAQEDAARNAFQKLNGVLIDKQPIKVEIIGIPPEPSKPISERTSQPKREKTQPKSAADVKGKEQQAKRAVGAKNNASRRGGRSARPVKKTAEELDHEMDDYFVSVVTNNTDGEGAALPNAPAGDDATMDEEIS